MERQNYYIRAGRLCFDCGISFRTFTIPRDTNLKDDRIIRFLIFAKQMVCSFHVCCPKELNVHLNMSSLCAFSHSNKNSPVCFNLRQDLLYNLVHFCSLLFTSLLFHGLTHKSKVLRRWLRRWLRRCVGTSNLF